jgi:hypothetical protein
MTNVINSNIVSKAIVSPNSLYVLHSGFLVWCDTETTWYVGHYLAYYTSPRLGMMMNVEQSVE